MIKITSQARYRRNGFCEENTYDRWARRLISLNEFFVFERDQSDRIV